MQFGPDHYVPVLKTKQGERQALGQIADAVKDRLTPLLEIDDLPEDLDTREPNRDVDHHSELILPPIAEGWGTSREFFLDACTMAAYQSTNGTNGVRYVFDEAASAGLQFIPVVGLRRSSVEITAAMAHRSRGLCLRLVDDDLASLSLQADIDAFLNRHGVRHEEVDLVIDLAIIFGDSAARVQALSVGYLRALPYTGNWRTLTLAASAFPQNMTVLQRGTSATFERTEWISWSSLYTQRAGLSRLPTFGDYGIQNPLVTEGFDPRFMAVSAAIRYTLDTEWLIIKGQSTKIVSGVPQYQGLARNLISRPEFMGVNHCPGCEEANRCAQGAAGYGSASVWRRIGTVHHLTHAAAQLSGLAFP